MMLRHLLIDVARILLHYYDGSQAKLPDTDRPPACLDGLAELRARVQVVVTADGDEVCTVLGGPQTATLHQCHWSCALLH